jgi:retron-type reverse transcriptase
MPDVFQPHGAILSGSNIKKLVAQPTYRMITLDSTNLYTNIPNTETLDIIQTRVQNNTQWDKELQKEVLDLVNATVKQNYFKASDMVWQQIDGTPMGSPISGILAEIFLQKIENKYYPNIIKKRHILFISRNVDDILIIFNTANTMAESILEDHNALHQTLKYKMETESNQQINFLDLNCTEGQMILH